MRPLIIRNTPNGMIWQIYHIKDNAEAVMLCKTARANGFSSCTDFYFDKIEDYPEETFPGWRDSSCWKERYAAEYEETKLKLSIGFNSY